METGTSPDNMQVQLRSRLGWIFVMLWFRNLQIFRLAPDHGLDAQTIANQLEKKPFLPCGNQDLFSQGWVPPAKHLPDLFAPCQQNSVLVCLKTEEKLLPAAIVRQQADERIFHIEQEEGRKVGKREVREIRERITEELLPRAFVKSHYQRAIIDLENNWIWIEAGSASKAENMLSILRETLGSLPSRLPDTQTSPQSAMTQWLEQEPPAEFELDSDCELRFPGDDGAVARFVRQALDADEVRKNIATGKLATRLGLIWRERLSFQLTEKLEIKRLTMLDVVQEEIESADAGDQAALFDISFALMIGELRQLIPQVMTVLGGEIAH